MRRRFRDFRNQFGIAAQIVVADASVFGRPRNFKDLIPRLEFNRKVRLHVLNDYHRGHRGLGEKEENS